MGAGFPEIHVGHCKTECKASVHFTSPFSRTLSLKLMNTGDEFFTWLLPAAPGLGKVQGRGMSFSSEGSLLWTHDRNFMCIPRVGTRRGRVPLMQTVNPAGTPEPVHGNPLRSPWKPMLPVPAQGSESAGLGGGCDNVQDETHRCDTETQPFSASPRPGQEHPTLTWHLSLSSPALGEQDRRDPCGVSFVRCLLPTERLAWTQLNFTRSFAVTKLSCLQAS